DDVRNASFAPPETPSSRPGRGARRRYWNNLLGERKLVFADPARHALVESIAQETEGYVGSDLESLCREAGMFAMREEVQLVGKRHFDESVNKVHATMNKVLRESYDRIRQHFKGGLPREVQPPEYQ
ncbi:MAG: ATPase, partial [Methanoregulaceae archaeon]|nr:ATPase [Methanoregulaceae archaeon]